MSSLKNKTCVPCESGGAPLTHDAVGALLREVPGWSLEHDRIARTFAFANYRETIAFVVRVAMLAEREGHHPVMAVGFREVRVEFWTHAINGLHENDFIMAAKVSAL